MHYGNRGIEVWVEEWRCVQHQHGSIAAEFSINTIICAFAGGGGSRKLLRNTMAA